MSDITLVAYEFLLPDSYFIASKTIWMLKQWGQR